MNSGEVHTMGYTGSSSFVILKKSSLNKDKSNPNGTDKNCKELDAGWFCTLEKDHPTDHVANSYDQIVHVWMRK